MWSAFCLVESLTRYLFLSQLILVFTIYFLFFFCVASTMRIEFIRNGFSSSFTNNILQVWFSSDKLFVVNFKLNTKEKNTLLKRAHLNIFHNVFSTFFLMPTHIYFSTEKLSCICLYINWHFAELLVCLIYISCDYLRNKTLPMRATKEMANVKKPLTVWEYLDNGTRNNYWNVWQ